MGRVNGQDLPPLVNGLLKVVIGIIVYTTVIIFPCQTALLCRETTLLPFLGLWSYAKLRLNLIDSNNGLDIGVVLTVYIAILCQGPAVIILS